MRLLVCEFVTCGDMMETARLLPCRRVQRQRAAPAGSANGQRSTVEKVSVPISDHPQPPFTNSHRP